MPLDRRTFLAQSGASAAGLFLAADAAEIRATLAYALRAVTSSPPPPWEYFTPEQAADVEAVASQIIPTDDTPGAREAGVVYFADRAFATWGAGRREPFTTGLDELNGEAARISPGARFARLSTEQQVALLRTRDQTPFFQMIRVMTIMGFMAHPSWGGNRDQAGWKLIGFEDRGAWQPPFGDYDAALERR